MAKYEVRCSCGHVWRVEFPPAHRTGEAYRQLAETPANSVLQSVQCPKDDCGITFDAGWRGTGTFFPHIPGSDHS